MTAVALGNLQSRFAGALLRPGDDGYEAARRVWNGLIDRRPAVIARCADTADIRTALRFGRDHGLPIAIRGGGHNIAGTAVCEGGLVIDCGLLRSVVVEPQRQIAHVSPGALWGDVDAATQAYGLATPGGIVTHTGVAGLTLGGGIGWLMRRFGLTCDNLLAADVVTAEGTAVHASESGDADLLWALRGGGGNFGIVTNFTFRLHPVGPHVLAGVILHPAERAREVLTFYREWVGAAPEEVTTIVSLRHAPPLSLIPAGLHGRPVVSIGVLYAGPPERGEEALASLRTFGQPLADLIRPTPYVAHQALFDPSVPHGLFYYWKTHYLTQLSNAAIEAICRHAWEMPSRTSFTLIFQMGGTVAAVPPGATAFAGRDAAFAVIINSVWTRPDPLEPQVAWARGFWDALRIEASQAAYVNFLQDEGVERVRATYGPPLYDRLAALKRRYDPENVFRLNQNIAPA